MQSSQEGKHFRILVSAVVKQPELQPTGTQVVNAQATGPSQSQGAHGSGSFDADTVQPASTTEIVEFTEVISDEATTEIRTAAAIAFKIRAVEYMAVSNKVDLKALIEELEHWRPCAASLRNSGIASIFDDITVWEGAALSVQAFALRSKFLRTMRQNRRRGSSESVIPFSEASTRQFKKHVDSMEAFLQEKEVNVADPGIFRRQPRHEQFHSSTFS